VIVTVGSNPTLSAYRPGAEVESQDLRHHVLVGRTSRWRGVVIAEGLRDPALINDLPVTRAFITADVQPLDQDGARGRWHLYWVEVSAGEIDQIQAATRYAWYAHFWRDDRLLVVYDEARFELPRHDRAAWQPAIDHGLEQGLRREWLDFPTGDSTGTLG
jgi:hypothetical protein